MSSSLLKVAAVLVAMVGDGRVQSVEGASAGCRCGVSVSGTGVSVGVGDGCRSV